jgi:Ca-activated chloride channel family protein
VAAHVVRVVFHLADGDRAAATVRTAGLGYADRVDVDAVQLAVVVTDLDGRFVPGLPRSAFRVFEDDVPQRVGSFVAENVPLELVAALDVSLSMTDAIPDLKRAARTFLAALPPAAEVSLVAFNDNVFTVARRAASPELRQRAVDRLAPWGGTALYDVIIRSLEQLDRQTGRRALVLFSDGEDQSSRSTERDAVARVEASDAMVYTVALGRGATVRPYRQLLERLASVSGGRGLFPDRSEELQGAFATIVEDLSHQYLIGYQPTNQVHDGAWRRVRVDVKGGAYTVRHRQGYRLIGEAR